MASSGGSSALLNTTIGVDGTAPISSSTERTAAIWPSGSAAVASTTWMKQVGLGDHLQRGLERLDEPVGKVTHEADRVGEQHGLATGQRQAPRRRVEGGESRSSTTRGRGRRFSSVDFPAFV